MNYHQARQRKDSGLWDWTTMNDGAVWSSGPCRGQKCSHATREEAESHFYGDQLDHLREVTLVDEQRKCKAPGCEAWSGKGLEARLLMGMTILCDEHRKREVFASLHPFSPGLEIIASW